MWKINFEAFKATSLDMSKFDRGFTGLWVRCHAFCFVEADLKYTFGRVLQRKALAQASIMVEYGLIKSLQCVGILACWAVYHGFLTKSRIELPIPTERSIHVVDKKDWITRQFIAQKKFPIDSLQLLFIQRSHHVKLSQLWPPGHVPSKAHHLLPENSLARQQPAFCVVR